MKKDLNVNLGNDYLEKKKDEVVQLLKEGKVIELYVSCIGHTRTQMVKSKYLEEIRKEVELKEGKDDIGWECYYI